MSQFSGVDTILISIQFYFIKKISVLCTTFRWPPLIENVLEHINLSLNHFQHIWITQFCEEDLYLGSDWSKITMDYAEGSDWSTKLVYVTGSHSLVKTLG